MLADLLGSGGAVGAIISAGVVVGGVLLTQVRRARGKGRARIAIDEVVVGVPEVKSLTGKVIQPERPGLIDRMDDMDDWRQDVDRKLDVILENVTPNGGDTGTPADTVVRIEEQVKQIADHIGLNLK